MSASERDAAGSNKYLSYHGRVEAKSNKATASLKRSNARAATVRKKALAKGADIRQDNEVHCKTSSYINTRYEVTVFTIFECSKAGCVFCEILYRGLRMVEAEMFPGTELPYSIRVDLSSGDEPVVRIWSRYTIYEIYRPMEGLERFDVQRATSSLGPTRESFSTRTIIRSEPISWIGQRPHSVPDSNSDACFLQLRSWLSKCHNGHPLCRTHDGSLLGLPKRLIDVRDPESVRLIATSDLPSTNVSYATLSHCWGKPGTQYRCVTQTQSLDQYLISIPWSQIPKTFRDAITATRRLKLGFLWIDSLCIIQDSMDDWAEESAKMSRIYANAVLTIAASAARNATDGFLGVRHHPKMNINTSAEKTLPLVIRKDTHANWYNTTSPRVIPLNTRGWVFQERLLSRRILHFEKKEIIWECRTVQSCECGSDLPPLSNQPASLRTAHTFLFENASKAETYAWWRNVIVDEYSKLKLTRWTDRLPALSGLAAVVREKTRDVYLAGLWLSDLACGLLWRPSSINVVYVDEVNGFCAPSWSWVHIKGPVSHERRLMTRTYVQLDDHSIELATVDPTGAVSTAILDIQVPLFPAYITNLNEEFNATVGIPPLNDSRYEVMARLSIENGAFQPGPMGLALVGVKEDYLDSQFCTVSFFGIIVGNYHAIDEDDVGLSQRIGYWTARFNMRVSDPYDEAALLKYMSRVRLR